MFPESSQSSSSTPKNNYYVPVVIEQDGRGERSFDIVSVLCREVPIDDVHAIPFAGRISVDPERSAGRGEPIGRDA